MKEKIIYSAYGIAFLLFVGMGWSLAENPTLGKGIAAAIMFTALIAGAKIVNRYAE